MGPGDRDVSGIAEFLHMGGYAFYVWTAYGAALLVLALNLAAPLVRRRRLARRRSEAATRARGAGPPPPPS